MGQTPRAARVKRAASSTKHKTTINTTPSPSTTTTPGTSQQTQEQIWTLKDPPILGEKGTKASVKYLLNWQGTDPETRVDYTPTWEGANNVSETDRANWQKKRREGKVREVVVNRKIEYHLRDDPKSPPPQAPKRKRIEDGSSSPLQKRARVPEEELTSSQVETSTAEEEGAFVSQDSDLVAHIVTEVKDSYEEDLPLSSAAGTGSNIRVEISVPRSLDRTAYAIFDASQSSPIENGRPQSQSQSQRLPRLHFPNLDSYIVPDSQDQAGSASYQQATATTQTPTSIEASSHIVDPEDYTQQDSEDLFPSLILSQSPEATYQAPEETQEDTETSQTESSRSEVVSSSNPIDQTTGLQNSSSQPRQSVSDASQTSSHLISPPRERDYLSEEASPILSQLHSSVPESNLPIQTQLSNESVRENAEALHREEELEPHQSQPHTLSQDAQIVPQSLNTQTEHLTQESNSTQEDFHSLLSPQSVKTFDPEPEFPAQDDSDRPLPSIELGIARTNHSPLHPRPSTASSFNSSIMEPPGSSSISERYLSKLRQLREDNYAERLVKKEEEQDTSASSIPSTPIPHVMAHPTALRDVPTEQPERQVELKSPSPKNSTEPPEDDEKLAGVKLVSDAQNKYYVPLPINTTTRDIYAQTVKIKKGQRYAFVTRNMSDGLLQEIDEMLSNLDLLCSHSDLILDDFSTQREQSVEHQARWAENQSTKCMFVAELLQALWPSSEHVAIFVRPGRMLEILDALLEYHGLTHQPANPEYSSDRSKLRVSLLPTNHSHPEFPVTPSSLIIAFDSTFGTTDTYLGDLRSKPFGNQSPLISLVVTHSVEHLTLCLQGDFESQPGEAKVRLVSYLSDPDISEQVGKLGPKDPTPPDAAKAIAAFITRNSADPMTWPCPEMPTVVFDDIDYSKSESGAVEGSSQSQSFSQTPDQISLKRQLELDSMEDRELSKRQRLTPAPNDEPESGHQVDSSALANGESHFLFFKEKIAALEAKLREKEIKENEYRHLNGTLERDILDLRSSINKIRPRYQEALNDRGEFQHQLETLTKKLDRLEGRYDAQEQTNIRLKEQLQAADTALKDARTELRASVVPEMKILETLREENRTLNADKERLNKKLTSNGSQLDYMTTNYRNASTSAGQSAMELREAKEEIETLRRKASENAVKIHEIHQSNEIAAHLQTIRQLRTDKEGLEMELNKKTAELAAVMNGRRPTRGTSVPRSPRMGTQGNMNRVIQGSTLSSRSRGASPATGDLGSGVARAYSSSNFAEALYPQAPPSSSRFGGHLQQ